MVMGLEIILDTYKKLWQPKGFYNNNFVNYCKVSIFP